MFDTKTKSIRRKDPTTGEPELWSHPYSPDITVMAAELKFVGDIRVIWVEVNDPFEFSDTKQYGKL